MMNSINVIGNVGNDPAISFFPKSGKRVARFSVAISNYGKNSEATWIQCEMWDAAIDRLTKCNVKKGVRIGITGSLAQSSWVKEGKTLRSLFVKVSSFQVLSAKGEVESMQAAEPTATAASSSAAIATAVFSGEQLPDADDQDSYDGSADHYGSAEPASEVRVAQAYENLAKAVVAPDAPRTRQAARRKVS